MLAPVRSELRLVAVALVLGALAVGWLAWTKMGHPTATPQDPLRRADDAPSLDLPTGPRIDPALSAAALEMVLPPPGTPLAIAGVDPRRLQNLMAQGVSSYRAASSDAGRQEALILIHTAAALGYGPARQLIAQDFIRSRLVRAVASVQEAMRYAMDGVVADRAHRAADILAIRAFAHYFEERKEATTFATHLIEIIRDDERLHAVNRISRLLQVLAPVEGACASIGRALTPRRSGPADCSQELAQAIARHAKAAGAVGLEDASRRRALGKLDRIGAP